jgi:hypothetical protein
VTILADIDTLAAEVVAEYTAGGYEPDGIGLALGTPPANDPDALGWGSDLACMLDGTPEMLELRGDDPRVVGEALFRRLTTAHGKIVADPELLVAVGEDPDYGYDLTGALHVEADRVTMRAKQDMAAAECMKDPRVETATVQFVQTGTSYFDVRVTARLKSGETFDGILPIRDLVAAGGT